ncbi:MAG TPA: zf-HC2 domain-containing protein [Caulobacteraceae bacterium]|nr:zf-HC2 domain-containing protein [Caulobacteraceae bacterium]
MSCAESLKTQAFLDGEVAGLEAEAVERHIESCPECQAQCADTAALSEAIRRHAPRLSAPADLRRRVEDAWSRERQRGSGPRRLPAFLGGGDFWRGALSGAGATALTAALAIVFSSPPSPGTLADQVTGAYARAMMTGRSIAVASSDHHTVKPWFEGRIPLSPPVADFAGQGFRLVGGRLDRLAGAPAAVVVYRHGKHEVDLFVTADRGRRMPPAATRHGYHALFWKAGDLDYAAVSDADPAELAAFSNLVRAEPE